MDACRKECDSLLRRIRMLNLKAKMVVAAFAAVVFVGSAIQNQAFAAEREIVKFRLTSWKAVHFDDAKSAKETHATLIKLGCEAKQEQHGGHIDVAFRCPRWRSVALKTHNEAHQWERWLKSLGFQTSHSH